MSVAGHARVQDHLIDILLVQLATVSDQALSDGIKKLHSRELAVSTRRHLRWHVEHSLSERQREVLTFYLMGKKEREIAGLLGIRQQVVNIYKHRALKKLRQIFSSNSLAQPSIG